MSALFDYFVKLVENTDGIKKRLIGSLIILSVILSGKENIFALVDQLRKFTFLEVFLSLSFISVYFYFLLLLFFWLY